MKHLLNGVAIAAALAIAAPAWAQAPAAGPAKAAPAAPTASPAAAAPKAAMAPKAKRPMRHAAKGGAKGGKMHKASAGDQATEQLNREELARIQGAAPAAPAAAPLSPGKTPR